MSTPLHFLRVLDFIQNITHLNEGVRSRIFLSLSLGAMSGGVPGCAQQGSSDPSATLETGALDVPSPREGPCGLANQGQPCAPGKSCHNGECLVDRCGDGRRASGEACDDGNQINGDGCSTQCRVERCGDGQVTGIEQCDDGNQTDGDGCSSTCRLQDICGDGEKTGIEGCDDGNTQAGDGCSPACQRESCGNGHLDPGEACDDGNHFAGDGCSPFCTLYYCGDRIITPPETCDDGNRIPGDGCSPACIREARCGDFIKDPQEECDDGNQQSGDGCSSDCTFEQGYCGDGQAQVNEACDDGNTQDGDGCSSRCEHESPEPACSPVNAERLPVRSAVLTKRRPSESIVFTQDLWDGFYRYCGSCHVETNAGDFQISSSNAIPGMRAWGDRIIATIQTNNPNVVMPPLEVGGILRKNRGLDDPVVFFASQLQTWLKTGSSQDFFFWSCGPQECAQSSKAAAFSVDHALSASLTKIGSCLPARGLLHRDQHKSQRMDRQFANRDTLPLRLSQTDLYTLDSAALARAGVLSYATTYELWADNARKMRYVKIPFGKKIGFDEQRQLFEIPENTRTYKTFLKKVSDHNGQTRFRKIETRVIVARKDEINDEGQARVRAIFGTYAWNQEETEAYLVTDPNRDGTPFADRVFLYSQDEAKLEAIKKSPPNSSLLSTLLREGTLRHYAIPGSQRCIHCHLGSVERNFVVGMSPLQLKRRPAGQAGVLDTPSQDELNLLARWIDLGVFEGLNHPDQIRGLEDPQPSLGPQSSPRPARGQLEVRAQGYMLGNCAHCHNPRGYASSRAPVLRNQLNLHPLTPGGGIYQFPIDRFSPRKRRGFAGSIEIPYLSPSLFDVGVQNNHPTGNLDDFPIETATRTFASGFANTLKAPWRSLIYRNIDTPFTYAADYAIWPRMPMHTAGYDCRVRDIMAEWMLSIPAKPLFKQGDRPYEIESTLAQPWAEVFPHEQGYQEAVAAAAQRISDYQDPEQNKRSSNSDRCQEIEQGTILDEFVTNGLRQEPLSNGESASNIPYSSHYTLYDFTEPPMPWMPRRWDWAQVLGATKDPQDCGLEINPKKREACEKKQQLRAQLRKSTIEPGLIDLALTPVPLAYWQPKAQCHFGDKELLSAIEPADRRPWMTLDPLGLKEEAPIYRQSPGQTLFKTICANCHGARGDSDGIMALQLNELTGGRSRVANFRSGMLGPQDQWGENIRRVFGPLEGESQAQTWAARYFAWMALGGTKSEIHSAILNIANDTGIAGYTRKGLDRLSDANMLSLAQQLCRSILPGDERRRLEFFIKPAKKGSFPSFTLRDPKSPNQGVPLTRRNGKWNGEGQMWLSLCSYKNPAPVRVLYPSPNTSGLMFVWTPENFKSIGTDTSKKFTGIFEATPTTMLPRTSLRGHPVGDRHELIHPSLTSSNTMPWCIAPVTQDAQTKRALEDWTQSMAPFFAGNPPPLCPRELFGDDGRPLAPATTQDIDAWINQGSINAGFSVFVYLQAMLEGTQPLSPEYDRCEERSSFNP